MTKNNKCLFCDYDSRVSNLSNIGASRYECRYCGVYIGDEIEFDMLPPDKFKMACVLNERRLKGFGGVALDDETKAGELVCGCPRISVNELLAQFPRTASEFLNRTLLNLSRLTPRPFSEITLNFQKPDYLYFFTQDTAECMTILEELSEQGLIRDNNSTAQSINKILTARSWEMIEDLQRQEINSKRVFVAMWFDSSMDDFYEKGIKPAIVNAGYDPVKIDSKEFNGKICDEIIAEIKRCKFLVSDFSGQRGGVYFEAGFAMGQGKPVIFAVQESEVKELHFDTRQYNHIVYNSTEDLYRKLYNRICATIV
ncbi:MAG: hypothetical protein ABFD91_00440 [Anaerohalosphaeraceae bacterium]